MSHFPGAPYGHAFRGRHKVTLSGCCLRSGHTFSSVQGRTANALLAAVSELSATLQLRPYDPVTGRGLLRQLVIRSSDRGACVWGGGL